MRGQRQASAAFYPRERSGTHCTGGWVGPRTGLDTCGKSDPHRDSIPDRAVRSQSLYRLSYPLLKVKWDTWKVSSDRMILGWIARGKHQVLLPISNHRNHRSHRSHRNHRSHCSYSSREHNSTQKNLFPLEIRPIHVTQTDTGGLRDSIKYRVIHKSLRDFRTRLRNNQDRHGRKEHINR